MREYLLKLTYTQGTWRRMAQVPGDRIRAAGTMLESLGGSLKFLCWELTTTSAYAIIELPDTTSTAAMQIMGDKTGAFQEIDVHELLDQEQLLKVLAQVREVSPAFRAPGCDDAGGPGDAAC